MGSALPPDNVLVGARRFAVENFGLQHRVATECDCCPLNGRPRQQGIYEAVQTTAMKRVLAMQLAEAMKERNLTKVEMTRRMRTSRVQLDRLLDPDNDSVTLATLCRAAAVVGRELRLELV